MRVCRNWLCGPGLKCRSWLKQMAWLKTPSCLPDRNYWSPRIGRISTSGEAGVQLSPRKTRTNLHKAGGPSRWIPLVTQMSAGPLVGGASDRQELTYGIELPAAKLHCYFGGQSFGTLYSSPFLYAPTNVATFIDQHL